MSCAAVPLAGDIRWSAVKAEHAEQIQTHCATMLVTTAGGLRVLVLLANPLLLSGSRPRPQEIWTESEGHRPRQVRLRRPTGNRISRSTKWTCDFDRPAGISAVLDRVDSYLLSSIDFVCCIVTPTDQNHASITLLRFSGQNMLILNSGNCCIVLDILGNYSCLF